ncbi:MAG: 30S ribosomal protein S5 [Candidatus Shikimatogenerans bostrichidophilus]|nr:MAG: 30S ribosomal protein S5 [Candidatus Shikimatogenerans bostrichidophilus]
MIIKKKKLFFSFNNLSIKEKVVKIKRVCKVTKGRREFSFTSIVVKGDNKGLVGYGVGKSKEISDSISKASVKANKNLIIVPIKNKTIPFEFMFKYCSTKIYLYPAREGTGIIAGSSARILLELSGINNIYTKFIGSSNVCNCVKATYYALKSLNEQYEIIKINRNKYGII